MRRRSLSPKSPRPSRPAGPCRETKAPTSAGSAAIPLRVPERLSWPGRDNDKLLAIISGGGVGWLFLSEAYYPGWKARIDGKEARIFSADYAFRAVFIPAGTHKLRLDYEPVSFRIGLYASFAAIIFIFIMCITGAAGKRGCKPKVE